MGKGCGEETPIFRWTVFENRFSKIENNYSKTEETTRRLFWSVLRPNLFLASLIVLHQRVLAGPKTSIFFDFCFLQIIFLFKFYVFFVLILYLYLSSILIITIRKMCWMWMTWSPIATARFDRMADDLKVQPHRSMIIVGLVHDRWLVLFSSFYFIFLFLFFFVFFWFSLNSKFKTKFFGVAVLLFVCFSPKFQFR